MPLPEPRHARALVWFRRDLRDFDHAALHAALTQARQVHCAFVFDREILDALPARADRRVEFIRDSVVELAAALRRARWRSASCVHDRAREAIPRLARDAPRRTPCTRITTTSPRRARATPTSRGRSPRRASRSHTCKDQVIFERDEV